MAGWETADLYRGTDWSLDGMLGEGGLAVRKELVLSSDASGS